MQTEGLGGRGPCGGPSRLPCLPGGFSPPVSMTRSALVVLASVTHPPPWPTRILSKAGVGVPPREIWGLLPDGGKIATEQVTLTHGR